jgi:ABC-type dipeptide/oligopeptide/nickel transport system ATPase component
MPRPSDDEEIDSAENKIDPKINGEVVMKMINEQLPCTTLIVGKTKSGKSVLMRYLLAYFTTVTAEFKYGMIMVGNKYIAKEYGMFPEGSVREYDESVLRKYIEELEDLHDEIGEDEMPRTFLVLDDCIGIIQDNNWFSHFVTTCRHLNICLFLSTQYLKARSAVNSTLVRENIGMLFCFRSNSSDTIKTMYDNWGSEVMRSRDDFEQRFRRCTKEKGSAMLYLNDVNYLTASENLLPFKAQMIPKDRKISFPDFKLKN